MTHQKKVSSRSVQIVKQIVVFQQKLLDEVFNHNAPQIQAILHQIIHGRTQHKFIKLYQYLLEAFLFAAGGDQSNLTYYAKQQYKPTFNRVKRAVKAGHCPKLANFQTFKGCRYQKAAKTCNEPAYVGGCPLPAFDMKRGSLNRMAFSLYFFLTDVCKGDFYTFTSRHFGEGQPTAALLHEFIRKVTTIASVGPKLAHGSKLIFRLDI